MSTGRVDGEEGATSAAPASPSPIDLLRTVLSRQDGRTLLGTVTEMLHVDGPTLVYGAVGSGMVAAPWSRVEVHGRVDGPVGLGRGCVLRVLGEFYGDVVGDDGLVVVSGQVSLEAARSGRVVIERGCLLVGNHGEGWCVADDGSVVRTDAARHSEVTGTTREVVVFDRHSQRFGPALAATAVASPVS